MLKRTTLAVIGMAASGFAFAGTMGPTCTPGNVTVPCEARQWDLGIQALYFRALYGTEKGYALVAPNRYTDLRNDWSWGFRAEGSYHFNTGNDLSIDWIHYSSTNALSGFSTILPLPNLLLVDTIFNVANQNRLDQVNLVLGQFTDVSVAKKMRFYGGVHYANIQSNFKNYFPVSLGTFTSFNQFDNSDFKGVGAVVGIDYSYYITNALTAIANGSSSILYGTSRYNMGYVAEPAELVYASVSAAKKSVVPALAAKLGLNYAYPIAQGTMNFEGGYQVINYFDALQAQILQSSLNPIKSINYGLYGPYLGIKYIGNV